MLKHGATSLGVPSDGERGDVDAVGGQQFRIGREIDGGNGVAGAVSAAGRRGAVNREWTAQQGAGAADVAGGDQLARAAGGDCRSADDARRIDGDAEAKLAAERFESLDSGLGVVTEAEVLAFVYLGDLDGVDENAVDAGGGEEFELAGERSDEPVRLLGVKDAGGVRLVVAALLA